MLYKTIDLCAGIGGIRKGFELTGRFENILAAEIDKYALRTYLHLYHQDADHDVTSDEFKELVEKTSFDVLLAGFPCQTFSSAGLRRGFEDDKKGIIFFHICQIIEKTRPKALFFENVENLVRHNNGDTFFTIISILEKQLNYKVVGVNNDFDGTKESYNVRDFIRNTKDFGLPQNRSRTYIIAFDKGRYLSKLDEVKNSLPAENNLMIYKDNNVIDLIEFGAEAQYYLSEKYLATLEKHLIDQKAKGNGFGYCVINNPLKPHKYSNTVLATGGSGKERNLIIDKKNDFAGRIVKGKHSPINNKSIRVMTPREWGKLQGFVNWAFIENGVDKFSFPDEIPMTQQYKQFGNAVSIPVIKTMADFLADNLDVLEKRS